MKRYKKGRKPVMYGFVCIYEGTNICMCEMRMQIRKSVSFLSFLFNSQWHGRVDNCERDWELFSIIIIIMRNVWSGGACRERHICRLHCVHVMRILEVNLRGTQEAKEAGYFRCKQHVPIPVQLGQSTPPSFHYYTMWRTQEQKLF